MGSKTQSSSVLVVADALAVVVGYVIAMLIRTLDPLVSGWALFGSDLIRVLPFIVIIHLVVNWLGRVYHGSEDRSTGMGLARLALATTVATVVVVALGIAARIGPGIVVPYMSLVFGGLFSFTLMWMRRLRMRSVGATGSG